MHAVSQLSPLDTGGAAGAAQFSWTLTARHTHPTAKTLSLQPEPLEERQRFLEPKHAKQVRTIRPIHTREQIRAHVRAPDPG